MNDSYKIRRFGRTLVITLPVEILKDAGLKEGDKVTLGMTPSGHVIMRRTSQDLDAARRRRYCGACGVEVTRADIEAGYCTNCKRRF